MTVIMNYGNSDIVFRRLKKYTRSREERMMKIRIYTHRALGMAGVVALVAGIILTGLATIAGAADNSNTSNHLTFYTNDGQVKSSMEDYGDGSTLRWPFLRVRSTRCSTSLTSAGNTTVLPIIPTAWMKLPLSHRT